MTLTEVKDKFLMDFFITKILKDKDLREYLYLIISKSLGYSVEEVEKDFELCDIKVGSSRYAKDSEVDLIAVSDIGFINIEANYRSDHKISDTKNLSYVCSLIVKQLTKGDENDYKNIRRVYQINLNNYDQFQEGKFIYTSSIMEKELHKERSDIQTIVDINMELLGNMDYTKIKELDKSSLERLLYIFTNSNREELDEIYRGDDLMEKVKNKLYKLDDRIDWAFVYNREELARQDYFAGGEEKGFARGKEEGKVEGELIGFERGRRDFIDLVKKLYENGTKAEEISKMANLSMEDINSILGIHS